MKRFLLLALVFSVMVTNAPALADGDFYVVAGGGAAGTKITSLPYTINSAGFYYLGKDLTSTGYGIIINADNVTIDLMGFSLNGSGGLVLEGISMYGRKNVEVRNGTVQSFYYGIQEHQAEGTNHRIVNIRSLSNIQAGISLQGNNHLVKGCTVSGNGNVGIDLQGSGSVIGNMIYIPNGTGIRLSTSNSNPIIVDQNTVSGTGTAYSAYSGGSAATVWAGKSSIYPIGNNAGGLLP